MIDVLESEWRAFCRLAAREQRNEAMWRRAGFPHYTQDGLWRRLPIDAAGGWRDDSFYDHGNWTAGFTVGQGWIARLGTPDRSTRPLPALDTALAVLATRATDDTTGDLGLLFHPAFAIAQIAGLIPAEACDPALEAARALAGRLRDPGAFLQAFGPPSDSRAAGTAAIDTMMTLPLLYWAAARSEDGDRFLEPARRHALTSARTFLRPDGSTYHHARFDVRSGELLDRGTFQGASSHSCWSRGQAWAVAGFAWSYAALGDTALLDAADLAWDYFAVRVSPDGTVPWDFSDEAPDATPDASASAIAAFGALALAHVHPLETRRRGLSEAAVSVLRRLASSSVRTDPRSDGILLRACYSKPHGLGVGGATPAGDYFYGLALALATDRISASALLGAAPHEQARARAALEPRSVDLPSA